MSKLYIHDLEIIKNGKIVRYNENTKEKYSSFISLGNINNEILELRRIRFTLQKLFRDDVNKELDWMKGSKIDSSYNVSFNPNKMFLKDYLILTIPTILGNSDCLFNNDGLVGVNGEIDSLLLQKCNKIIPYIKKLYNVIEQSKALNNSFYEDYSVVDNTNDKIFNINGDGIVLPFKEYDEFQNPAMQEILIYYYKYYDDILKNVLIPNTQILNNYRRDINIDKALKLYKGEK